VEAAEEALARAPPPAPAPVVLAVDHALAASVRLVAEAAARGQVADQTEALKTLGTHVHLPWLRL
jgi:hypothetical protein